MRSLPRRVLCGLVFLLIACGDAPVVRPGPLLKQPEGSNAAPPIAPEWVVNGISDAHPDAIWLQAVGAAEIGASVQDARERAEFKARGGLVRNLSSTVRSATESHELFEANDHQSRLQISLEQTVEVVGAGTLEGARPVDFFIDEKANAAHCLLVLERAPAARELARRVAQQEADAAALLARAKAAAPGPALLALCEAYDHVLAARVLRVSYAVLANGPMAARDSIGDQVLASLRAASSELTLYLDSDQRQLGRVGSELAAPIGVQLKAASGRGVEGLPLRFTVRGKAKAELSPPLLATAGEGRAAFAVRAIGTSGQRSNQIDVQIDALASRSLPGPHVIAEYLLPTPQDTRVLVCATAQAYGEPADAGALQTGVIDALAKADFAVVPAASVADKIGVNELSQAATTEVCQRLRGAADYVVRVTGAVQSNTGGRDRPRARTSAVVLVIDIATGQVDQFLSDPVDGVGDSHGQAAAAGLARLGGAVGSAIVARVRARAGV